MTDTAAQLAASPANGTALANSRNNNIVTESQSPGSTTQHSSTASRSPKKRRKVNHACVYCRRSHMTCDEERPCGRCLKRNIGHLCHDEPREPKKLKQEATQGIGHEEVKVTMPTAIEKPSVNDIPTPVEQTQAPLAPPPIPLPRHTAAPPIVAPSPVSVTPRQGLNSNAQGFLGATDWDFIHSTNTQPSWLANPYHQQWMFSANEAADEFNSMSDWVGNFHDDSNFFNDGSFFGGLNDMLQADAAYSTALTQAKDIQTQERPQPPVAPPVQRPASVKPTEKAREHYYLTAADPTKDNPEERMKQILRAKYQAGLLKPFNYVKGYARLGSFMEQHYAPTSRLRIARQLDKFRPKFREKTQKLTDLDLVSVEEWFEKILMEYDRVFASMAIPACLWRRTGEIFRGNKEFAELIKVPIERLRDGKLAIYELISEESFFCYWDKFGSIAFDTSQKAMLTTCQLRNPDSNAASKFINCCFSFTIRRDIYDM
ncbi:hypothetical protein BDZ91DRAFT_798971 [Kalaharituber pfeilii]|nr:hypothetical protein BDZ91DRAFT_798971 [Kalaharituber pfeilii]